MPDLPRPDNILDLFRVGPRLAVAALRLAGVALRGAADLIDHTLGGEQAAPAKPDAQDGDRLWDERGERTGAVRPPASEPAPRPRAEAPEAPVDEPPAQPSSPEPDHLSEEPVLVAEVADAGAEDGPGAEIHVDEPWPGYSEMTAPDVIDRLAAESVEAVALVELYERTHRGRRSVLDAAEREQRRGGGPPGRQS